MKDSPELAAKRKKFNRWFNWIMMILFTGFFAFCWLFWLKISDSSYDLKSQPMSDVIHSAYLQWEKQTCAESPDNCTMNLRQLVLRHDKSRYFQNRMREDTNMTDYAVVRVTVASGGALGCGPTWFHQYGCKSVRVSSSLFLQPGFKEMFDEAIRNPCTFTKNPTVAADSKRVIDPLYYEFECRESKIGNPFDVVVIEKTNATTAITLNFYEATR